VSQVEPSSVEEWARVYVLETRLDRKIAPAPPPDTWQRSPLPLRLQAPGRPIELCLVRRAPRSPKPAALVEPRQRARLLHTFWHHELQAAELMCWALLAFADAEPDFRRGLLRVCSDEIGHMRLYQRHIEHLGHRIGDFEVRDWFWERVPTARTKLSFVALMGMGLEAANLEHAPQFADWFRAAGDTLGAEIQARIAADELAHVRFATHWFRRWTGGCRFEDWTLNLPRPLSPLLLRGRVIAREARLAAGMPEEFVSALAAWAPSE
jgi:uncharacterized ferritin-like protein (DUF455 family)